MKEEDFVSGSPGIQIRGLEVDRGGCCLLEGLDCFVPNGTFLAVTGKSGSGKTSLLSCMGGMFDPKKGTVRYRGSGSAVSAPRDFRLHLGLVFQHLLLVPNSSARTNVLCGLLGQLPWWRTLLGFPKPYEVEAAGLLERFGIRDTALVARLSGGERQRVAIARALIAKPRAILADEPVSSLDPDLARDALGILQQAARKGEVAVVCVLHDPGLVEEFADQVLTLDRNIPCGWRLEKGKAR